MTAANLRAPPTFQNYNGNENSVRTKKKRICDEEDSIDDIAAVAMDFNNDPGKGGSKKRVCRHGVWEDTINEYVCVCQSQSTKLVVLEKNCLIL